MPPLICTPCAAHPPRAQVAEPKQDNSGIPQGIFVRRHRVPRDDGSGAAIAPGDLAVGATVTVYGRTFFLVSCSEDNRLVVAGNAGRRHPV